MALTEAARAERNAYKRKWNKDHPGKNREYQERYWERRAKKAAETGRKGMIEPADGK